MSRRLARRPRVLERERVRASHRLTTRLLSALALAALMLAGCDDDRAFIDAGPRDAGLDAAPIEDSGPPPDGDVDAGGLDDAGPIESDAGPIGPRACTTTPECGGGACEDGFCCAASCGQCASCGVAGSEGTCTPEAGAPCNDGDSATIEDMCQADGTCAGTPGCPQPADACANATTNLDNGCATARIIGRGLAAGGYGSVASLCSASDDFDDCSWDAGADHAYRVWMRQGETVTASVTMSASCGDVAITLKAFEGSDCTTVSCGSDLWCERVNNNEQVSHTATRDAWVVIVVDASTAFDDEGGYQLTVNLSGCADATCGC